jgi:hypothetical protein
MKILYSQKKYYLVVTLYKKIFSKWPGALAAGAKAPGPLGTGPLDTRGFTLKVQYLKVQA